MDISQNFVAFSEYMNFNPQYGKRLFIEFPEKYKFTTCCGQKLFFFLNFVLTFNTIFVHNMLWTCIFRGIQWTISRDIVGLNWFKNESFWKIFTLYILFNGSKKNQFWKYKSCFFKRNLFLAWSKCVFWQKLFCMVVKSWHFRL